MNRKDIEKAAGEYSGSILGCKGNSVKAKYQSFIDGAEWILNSIWHTNSEKPRIGRTALVIYKGGGVDICSDILSFENWDSVDTWAYIEDLLPIKNE